MENKKQLCPILGDTVTRIIRCNERDAFVVEGSPRIGGDYKISAQARQDVGALDPKDKAKLTTFLLELRRAGDRTPLVDSDLVEKAKIADPLPVYTRAERLLRYLVNVPKHVGQPFDLLNPPPRNLEALAWSESTSWDEIYYFANYLTSMRWLEKEKNAQVYRITVSGYERVAEQSTKKDLSQCFVAMWFDDSMNKAYEEGIEKAVDECGYESRRIDKKPTVNKIDDEVIAEIRRSRFVVADFTHGADGARGSVYYEAGFAHALGLPVIFSCRKDQEKQLHFDTRQYPHILWENPEDLYAKLTERIGAVIGEQTASLPDAARE